MSFVDKKNDAANLNDSRRGFAGLNCAQALAAMANVRVTLLERNNYQQFQPLLYQVATASLAAFSLRSILWKQESVDVRMMGVVSIDLSGRRVTGRDGSGRDTRLFIQRGREPHRYGSTSGISLSQQGAIHAIR